MQTSTNMKNKRKQWDNWRNMRLTFTSTFSRQSVIFLRNVGNYCFLLFGESTRPQKSSASQSGWQRICKIQTLPPRNGFVTGDRSGPKFSVLLHGLRSFAPSLKAPWTWFWCAGNRKTPSWLEQYPMWSRTQREMTAMFLVSRLPNKGRKVFLQVPEVKVECNRIFF